MSKATTGGRKEETRKLWTSLVESAFDFLERALDEYDSSPKYAILHLAASVELLLKARLMAEHWTLIISPKHTPTFDRLKSGDFLSVTLSEAIERLGGVLPNEHHVTRDAKDEFLSLLKERNKVAHFFHTDLDGTSSPESILQRQCRVWFYLHRLLDAVWGDVFKDFSSHLAKLNWTMKGKRKFLSAVFDSVKSELELLKKRGSTVLSCQACGFESLVVTASHSVFGQAHCKVCGYRGAVLQVDCPDCKKSVVLTSGDDQCICGHEFSPEQLEDILELHRPYEGHAPEYIHCPMCISDCVFPVEGEYACLNCLETFKDVGQCDWCSTVVAGGVGEDSYWRGCEFCEGQSEYLMSKDD